MNIKLLVLTVFLVVTSALGDDETKIGRKRYFGTRCRTEISPRIEDESINEMKTSECGYGRVREKRDVEVNGIKRPDAHEYPYTSSLLEKLGIPMSEAKKRHHERYHLYRHRGTTSLTRTTASEME